ncbi:DUF2812 domain-containing protein [Streptococcus ruminantium]|uniref:DUF2812 domain-containing protein n=1 Tax=Streptococcus ruminantium TaxID=1917441 RepID=UPI0012DDDAA4|nr:DUF2812 domain-containing protein [Streptococcus ruminantium]
MKKRKLFTSLQDEENWINMIQSQGYQLMKVNPLLATYHFEKCTAAPKPVRLDFREQILKEEYPNYLSLFSDYGWEPIQGSKRNGVHYFQKMNATSDTNIFSDKESKKAFYSRYQNYAYSYFGLFLTLFFIHYQVGLQNGYTLWNPKSWYLTPGLWERTGTSFWFGFLFETPFALFRSGIIPLFFLAWSIYFLCIAEKVKREIKNLGE